MLIAVSNLSFAFFGPLGAETPLSMQLILGWLHWPVAFLMGTPFQDCLVVGRMLGEKLILTEFVAYADLAGYLAGGPQGTVMALDPRSVVITSYALSGFRQLRFDRDPDRRDFAARSFPSARNRETGA